MDTYATLNDALVKLFRDVMDLEEQAIITQEFQDITNNDVHVIQAIGTGKEDRRVVYISLSEKGRHAYEHHEQFHHDMIEAILQDLTLDETESLVKALAKLNLWFRKAKG